MAEQLSIESLRSMLQQRDSGAEAADDVRFEAGARRFERAVQALVSQITAVVAQVPELAITLEDEIETFTSPAFPGKSVDIRDQRIRITRGDDMLLFDPTAKALLSALGQVEVEATRPLSFMVEKVLYLISDRTGQRAIWGYRSVENLGGPLAPFNQQALLRILAAVFA